jgi:hypothetical protein
MNLDFQLIIDPVVLMEHICKYAAKPERASQEALSIFKKIARYDGENMRMISILRSAMLKTAGARDYGAPEIVYCSMHFPLIESNLTFVLVSLDGSSKLQLGHSNRSKQVASKSLWPFYALHDQIPRKLQHSVGLSNDELFEITFRDFSYAFQVKSNKLQKSNLPRSKLLILRFYPSSRTAATHVNYYRHCMYSTNLSSTRLSRHNH